MSQQFEVNAVTISKWKPKYLENMAIVFEHGWEKKSDLRTPELDDLYAQIGQLKAENDFFIKSQKTWDIGQRLEMIKPRHKELSIRKQCKILMVPRSSLYYQPIPEKPENVKMMNFMDQHLLTNPTEGVVSMIDTLRDMGYPVDPKRIRSLFRVMGRQTLYRRKSLTKKTLKGVYHALFTAWVKDYSCQSVMVFGYYLHPHGQRVCVYDCFY